MNLSTSFSTQKVRKKEKEKSYGSVETSSPYNLERIHFKWYVIQNITAKICNNVGVVTGYDIL